ncbi:hypothetical protein FR943_04950 [Mycobacterium sp. TNTM28]|uniref:Uncharacterized protein n=2 Tax=[Mycobacterium] fortunisiensis TaxID=2600579 RepID=A0ABS6KHZ8_9MYCO|nr:hypothetical protein [[Mycobacterium] fortunisiensis]
MAIDYNDQRLDRGLRSLVLEHRSGRLSEFTSWDWDEVHLFDEYSDREFIENTVGAPVIRSRYPDSKGNLLVFKLKGEPIKAAGISPDFLRTEDHRVTFPSDVMLEPWGDGCLMLTVAASR